MLCQKGSHPLFLPIVRDVVDWSRTKQVTLSRPTRHTRPCTCTYTQRPRSDLSAWPMCTISKEAFRSHQSSMNTDSEEISGVNGLNKFFHLCTQQYFCFVNSGGLSLRDRMKGEIRYNACNFSVHTRLQTHKDLHTKRKGIPNCLNTL